MATYTHIFLISPLFPHPQQGLQHLGTLHPRHLAFWVHTCHSNSWEYIGIVHKYFLEFHPFCEFTSNNSRGSTWSSSQWEAHRGRTIPEASSDFDQSRNNDLSLTENVQSMTWLHPFHLEPLGLDAEQGTHQVFPNLFNINTYQLISECMQIISYWSKWFTSLFAKI